MLQIHRNFGYLEEYLRQLEYKRQDACRAFSKFSSPDAALIIEKAKGRLGIQDPPQLQFLRLKLDKDSISKPPKFDEPAPMPHSDLPAEYYEANNNVNVVEMPPPKKTTRAGSTKRTQPLAQVPTERAIPVLMKPGSIQRIEI